MKHIYFFLVELFVRIFIKKVYFKLTGALSLIVTWARFGLKLWRRRLIHR
jgi:hypothetical protein